MVLTGEQGSYLKCRKKLAVARMSTIEKEWFLQYLSDLRNRGFATLSQNR